MAVISKKINESGGGYRIHDDFIKGEEESREIVKRVSRILTKSLLRQNMEKNQKESEMQG